MRTTKRMIAWLAAPALVGTMLVTALVPSAAVADPSSPCTHAAGHGVPELQGCVDPELIEAEDADLSDGLERGDAHTGYSGSSFIGTLYDEGESIAFDLYHPGVQSSTGDLRIRYANGEESRTLSLYVDGSKLKQLTFPSSGSWDDWDWLDVTGVPTSGDVTAVSLQVDEDDTAKVNIDAFSYVAGQVTIAPVPFGTSWKDVPFTQQLGAVGGHAPYTFAVVSGALPAGLTLSNDGVLAGTPTSSDSASFTVEATDANGLTGTRELDFQVRTEPVVDVSSSADTSSPVTVSGAGFPPGQDVSLSWDPQSGAEKTVTVDSEGAFTSTLTAPETAGTYEIVADDGSSVVRSSVDVVRRASTVSLMSNLAVVRYGDPVVFTVTVDGGQGTVQLFDGTTPVSSAPLNDGTVDITVADLSRGHHVLTAEFPGDDGIESGTSAPLGITVKRRLASVTLTSDQSTIEAGDELVLTVGVDAGSSGSVEVYDGGTSLGTADVTDGSATLTVPSLEPGHHTLVAIYYGDHNLLPGASDELVVRVKTRTVTLSSPVLSVSSQVFGDRRVAHRGLVSVDVVGVESGTVTFSDGERVVGSAPVVDGAARFTLPRKLGVGEHRFTASVEATASTSAAVSPESAVFTVKKAKLKKLKVKATKKVRKKGYRPHHQVKVKVKASKKLTSGTVAKGKVKLRVKQHGSFTTVKKKSMKKFRQGGGKLKLKIAKRYVHGKKVKVKAVYKPKKAWHSTVKKKKQKIVLHRR